MTIRRRRRRRPHRYRHVHYRRRVRKAGTEFVCPCLGYRAEWQARDGKPADTAGEIAATLSVWDLGKDPPRFVES